MNALIFEAVNDALRNVAIVILDKRRRRRLLCDVFRSDAFVQRRRALNDVVLVAFRVGGSLKK